MNDSNITQDGFIDGNSFKIFCPVEILSKSEKDADDEFSDCYIKGIASTEDKDIQQEILKSNGLDIASLKEGRGIFNYDHKIGPENVIGKIENAEITGDGLSVEGYLFKAHDRGRAFLQILKSLKPKDKHRVQMSVEGKILERSGPCEKIITKAEITKVALTLDPVNPKTYTELCKSIMGGSIVGLPDGIGKDLKKEQEMKKKNAKNTIKKSEDGTVTLNLPLFIRLLEWAKEDVKDDLDLHNAAEIALKMSSDNKTLKMEHYDEIINEKDENKDNNDDEKLEKEIVEKSQKNTEKLVLSLDRTLRHLIKTLGVGNAYTVAPTQMSGGGALTMESMSSPRKKKKKKKKV